jgi:hypothetical protein
METVSVEYWAGTSTGHYQGFICSTLQVYQRSYSQVGHIPPKMSDKFESQHYLIGRESGYKIFFYISRGEHVKHFMCEFGWKLYL